MPSIRSPLAEAVSRTITDFERKYGPKILGVLRR
jgi:hypothetical protein